MDDAKTRFSSCADAYAAHRPAYGDEVIAFVLAGLGLAPSVADLGAGTGISSRRLAAAGAKVFAIEPNLAMRERAEAEPGVTFLDGSGERTGLESSSVDAVTAFQAFHWFANDEALAEIRRIVRSGGTAALILNERDPGDPFTAAYGDIVRRYALDDTERRRMQSMDIFERLPGVAERRTFSNGQVLDRDGLVGRTRSTSYLPHEGAASEALEREVGELFDRDAVEGRVRLVLLTWIVRVQLP
jgi:SAM-dependent methyltransferase